jgi:uncharacterized protein YndB with AHSA1/START domain
MAHAQAQVSRRIDASPEKVWRTLTSKAGMKAYMMGADVDADWRVGGALTLRGEYQGRRFEDHGEVRSFEPTRKLAYTHVSGSAPDEVHLVTFELQPRGEGTEITVTQTAAEGAAEEVSDQTRALYEKTWTAMLEGLDKAARA